MPFDRQHYEALRQREQAELGSVPFNREIYEKLKQAEKGAIPDVGSINELLKASGIEPSMISSLPEAGRSVVPYAIPKIDDTIEAPVAPAVSTAVAMPEGLRRQPSIEAREPSLIQRAGQKIVETAQTHRELLEEANKVVTDFTKSVPKEDIRSLMIRGAAGVVTGIGSFMGADIPEAIGSVLAAEEGYRGKEAEAKASEFVSGMRELAGSALVVGDKLIRKHLEIVPDPFAQEAYESYVEKTGGYKIMELILGRKFTKEDYDKVVQQAIDRPEQPVFGALILTGGLRAGKKLSKKAATRYGPALRETLTKKRKFFDEGKVEKLRPTTEEAMRTEMIEMSDMAESFGAKFPTKDQIKGMTRAELEYHTGRTKKAPLEEAAEYKKETERVPERIEEARQPVSEKLEVPKTPEQWGEELGIKYKGQQDVLKRTPEGEIIRDAGGKAVIEKGYSFDLLEPGKETTFTVPKLEDLPAKLKAKKAEFGIEETKPVPVELGFMGATPKNMAELSHNVGRGLDAIARTAETVARKGTPDFLKQARNRGIDPTFKDIMRDIEVVDEKWHRRAGQSVEQFRDAGLKKLSNEGAISLADALEGKGTKEQVEAAKPYRKALDQIYHKSNALGLKFRYTSRYFPRIWKTEVLETVFDDVAPLIRELSEGKFSDQAIGKRLEATKGVTYKIVQHMLDTKQAKSYGDALRKLERDASAELFPESSFERPRKLDLPSEVYERNAKKVLPAYADVMTKRMAIAEHWGAPTGEKLHKKLNKLSLDNPNEAKIANKIVEMWSGEYERHYGLRGASRKVVDAYMGFETTTKIAGGTATIPNITQTFISTLPEWGTYKVIRGGLDLMTEAGRKYAREAGIFRESMIQAYAGKEPKGKVGRLTRKSLTAVGFMAINKFNIALAATTARHGIRALHEAAQGTGVKANWAKKRLADFGLKPTDKLTTNVIAEKSFRFAIDSQLQRNVLKDPLIANDPRWRPLWLFKRFGYRQAVFSKDMLLREAKRGNPMPVLRMAAGGLLGGEFVIWARNQIKEFLSGQPQYRKEDLLTWHRVVNNIAAVGSFGVISDIMDIEKMSQLYGALKFTVSPVFISDIENLGEAYLDITRDLEKYHDPKLTLDRNYHHVLDNLGSLSRWTGKRLRTTPQKERGLKYAKGRERIAILDLMIEGEKDDAKRRVKLWNKNYPDNRFEAEDFSMKEIKKRLQDNQRNYEQAKGTYEKKKKKSRFRPKRRRGR